MPTKVMRYLSVLLFYVVSFCLFGQTNSYQAPLNPDFVSQKVKEGYVNAPYKVNYNTIKARSGRVLPSKFDLRDVEGRSFVSEIRNQGKYGACWAFATLASVESSWKKSAGADDIDLSESNMAKCHGYELGVDDGGNMFMSTAYLSRLAGPVYESVDPYSNIANNTCLAINAKDDIPAYVSNIVWVGNDRNLIKEMLMDHGVASTNMNSTFSDAYYDSDNYTFFFNGTAPPNHGVSIVGWDDDMLITAGTSGTPKSPGAWIVRNSWGTSAQDGGYFYASYEDKYIGKQCEFYYGQTLISEVDTLFDYATLGAVTASRVGNNATEVAYAAVHYETDKTIFITHVGTGVLVEGTTVDLAICRTFDGVSFSDTIAQQEGFFCKHSGFQKLELPSLIERGSFYIVTKYYTPQSSFPLPVEAKVDGYALPRIEEDKMWLSANGESWEPGGLNTDYEFDLAIKVFAQFPGQIQPYFVLDRTKSCVGQELEFINRSYGEADSFVWVVDGERFVTMSVDSSISYVFNTVGDKEVGMHAYSGGIAYSFVKKKAVTVVDQIYPQIQVANPSDYYSKGKPITLIASGADAYQWYAEGYLDGRIGRVITFAPDVDELWVRIQAQMGNCFEEDSVLLRFIEVPYDDIQDALLLQIGVPVVGISNAYASVEVNEPFPEIGSCESQSTWCSEGGLHNSLWFKFAAPPSGRVEVNTHGFDTQIALYDATRTGEWEDIMSGYADDYTILAANDDYHEDDFSAFIEEVSGLIPDKTYWMQMDGSAGGVVGSATVVVTDASISKLDEKNEYSYTLVNTTELFSLYGNGLNGATLSIVNSMGQKIYGQIINSDFTSLNGDLLKEGVYFVSINNTQTHLVYKVVVSSRWKLTLHER